MSPTLKARALLIKALEHICTQQALLNQGDERAKALLRKRNVAVRVAVRYAGCATAAEAERDRLKARVAELESAFRKYLRKHRALSNPPPMFRHRSWSQHRADDEQAERVLEGSIAVLAQETKP